jgi:sterol 3beta-glucosyltransferase
MTGRKKVLIVAPGSRGDFGPYTGLGVRFRDAGHHVVIAAHAEWRGMVEALGLEFHPLAGDSRDAQGSEEMQAWQESGSGAKSAKQGVKMVKLVAGMLRDQAHDVMVAAKDDVDVIMPSVLGGIAFLVAEGMRIPTLSAYVGPTEPTGDFPPPGLGFNQSLGRWGNRKLYGALAAIVRSSSKKTVAELREELGMGTETKGQRTAEGDIYYGYSPELVPPPADWRPGTHTVGFWWPPKLSGWEPPARLVDFLAAGEPPVSISFGSMAEGRSEQLSELVTAAVRKAGVRAVIQAGWAKLDVSADDAITVDGELDYEWLYPQVATVVQHGGIGTTGCALRAADHRADGRRRALLGQPGHPDRRFARCRAVHEADRRPSRRGDQGGGGEIRISPPRPAGRRQGRPGRRRRPRPRGP